MIAPQRHGADRSDLYQWGPVTLARHAVLVPRDRAGPRGTALVPAGPRWAVVCPRTLAPVNPAPWLVW